MTLPSVKQWIELVSKTLGLLAIIGGAIVWAGDTRYLLVMDFKSYTQQQEITELDREITYLQIKIDQDEASKSEQIYIETLRQQLRALKNQQ